MKAEWIKWAEKEIDALLEKEGKTMNYQKTLRYRGQKLHLIEAIKYTKRRLK